MRCIKAISWSGYGVVTEWFICQPVDKWITSLHIYLLFTFYILYRNNTQSIRCSSYVKGKGSCIETEGNDLGMDMDGMDQIIWELRLWGEFWIPTWVWSGEHMESYGGFEIMDIRWNGWLIMMLIEVPAVFGTGQDPTLPIKTGWHMGIILARFIPQSLSYILCVSVMECCVNGWSYLLPTLKICCVRFLTGTITYAAIIWMVESMCRRLSWWVFDCP